MLMEDLVNLKIPAIESELKRQLARKMDAEAAQELLSKKVGTEQFEQLVDRLNKVEELANQKIEFAKQNPIDEEDEEEEAMDEMEAMEAEANSPGTVSPD
jgi:hypothetical protein